MDNVMIIDPPSGWKYGFPKPIPMNILFSDDETLKEWFLLNGYPQTLIDQGCLKHYRYWFSNE